MGKSLKIEQLTIYHIKKVGYMNWNRLVSDMLIFSIA